MTGMRTRKIAYVVVNYFSHEKVAKLVSSIEPMDGVSGVIVDNSADDIEYDALKAAVNRSDICCIQSPRNGGFSFGTNIGIRKILHDVDAVLILNPDTEVMPNFFSTLISLNASIPDAAISPHGKRMDSGETWSAGGRFHWLRGRADVLTSARKSGETEFGTCACLMVPSAAIKEIGVLDEDFFLGGEEWDYSLRLRRAGWSIIYCSHAVYRHEVSGTHEKYGLRFFYTGMRTKTLFARKHYGALFWPWLLFVMMPSMPLVLLRNTRLQHGTILQLVPRLVLAVVRSVRKLPMTAKEYQTNGMRR